VPLSAAESRRILKALTEGVWVTNPENPLHGQQAFHLLGLTEADGWKAPVPKPNEDYPELVRATFAKWLDGPGKDYRVKKLVVKK
jgi:hypothetical protein